MRARLHAQRVGRLRPLLADEQADKELQRRHGGPAPGVVVPDPARLALGAVQDAAAKEQVRVFQPQIGVRRRLRELPVEEHFSPVELPGRGPEIDQRPAGDKVVPVQFQGPAEQRLRLGIPLQAHENLGLAPGKLGGPGPKRIRAVEQRQSAVEIARIGFQYPEALSEGGVVRVLLERPFHGVEGRGPRVRHSQAGVRGLNLPAQPRLVLAERGLVRERGPERQLDDGVEHLELRLGGVSERACAAVRVQPIPGARVRAEKRLRARVGEQLRHLEISSPVEVNVVKQDLVAGQGGRGSAVRTHGPRRIHQGHRAPGPLRDLPDDLVDARVRTEPQRIPMQGVQIAPAGNLGLAERLLADDPVARLRGRILSALTVYVTASVVAITGRVKRAVDSMQLLTHAISKLQDVMGAGGDRVLALTV